MPNRFLLAVALAAALVPEVARPGVTLHYSGTVRSESDVAVIVDKAVAFAKTKGWPFEKRATGIVLQPHAWSEPVGLLFEGRRLSENWVKTQFAGPEAHIGVVELFRLLKPRLRRRPGTDPVAAVCGIQSRLLGMRLAAPARCAGPVAAEVAQARLQRG